LFIISSDDKDELSGANRDGPAIPFEGHEVKRRLLLLRTTLEDAFDRMLFEFVLPIEENRRSVDVEFETKLSTGCASYTSGFSESSKPQIRRGSQKLGPERE
jgi:hypothetical protein